MFYRLGKKSKKSSEESALGTRLGAGGRVGEWQPRVKSVIISILGNFIRQSKTDSSKPCIFCVRSEIILKEFRTPVYLAFAISVDGLAY